MIDEGYIKFRSNWQRTGALQLPEIDELIKWRKPLYAAGLIGHFVDVGIGYGNLSIRAGEDGQFLISGTQTGHLAEPGSEHFALVTAFSISDNSVSSRGATEASSESLTHGALYALDPDIRAVVHVHDDELWTGLKGRLATTGDQIAYGTPEMAAEFARLLKETDFARTGLAVMAGHEGGLISTGSSVQQAADRILSLRRRL